VVYLCFVRPHSRVIPNRELELQLFDEFRRLSPDLTFTHIEQPDPPAPDILAGFRGSRIGIEITRHIRRAEKHRESEEECIIEMARRQYQATGKPTVGVSVHWITHEPRARSDRAPLSRALVSVVAQNVPQLGTCRDLDCSSLAEPLASTVHYVRIDRLIDYTESDWRLPRAGWFPKVQPDDIRRAVAKKESGFDDYRQHCDAVWLLIASEGFGPSSWCELSSETRYGAYSSRFSRIFFLATHPKEVIEFSVNKYEA
jgi:hypothetical protein